MVKLYVIKSKDALSGGIRITGGLVLIDNKGIIKKHTCITFIIIVIITFVFLCFKWISYSL